MTRSWLQLDRILLFLRLPVWRAAMYIILLRLTAKRSQLAGMYLARAGHNVTMLISEKELFPYNRGHYTITMIEAYKDLKNFGIITEGRATGISAGKVTYKDS